MSQAKPTYKELEQRCRNAESALAAIRSGQADTVIGEQGTLVLRLQEAEKALQAAELKYRTLAESSPDIIYIVDLTTHKSAFLNRETLLGYTLEELEQPGSLLSKVHPDDLPAVQAHWQAALSGNASAALEYRLQTKDGNWEWLNSRSRVLDRDAAGKPTQLLVTLSIVTERKMAEDKLQVSEHTLKLFVEYAPAAIAMFDREMRYLAVSRRFIGDYRLPGEDIIGRSHYEIFPEISPRWKEIHQRCLAGATEKAEAEVFPRMDGSVDWVRWEIHPWYQASGQVGGIILFSEVITERKQTEEKLAESEKRFRALIEHSSDGIAVLDRNGKIIYESPAVDRITGFNAEERVGGNGFEYIHVDDLPEVIDQFARVASQPGNVIRTEYRVMRKDGSIWWADAIATNLLEEPGIQGIVVNFRDVSERKLAEVVLREREQKMNKLLEILPVGVSILDAERQVVFNNPALRQILQITEDGLSRGEYHQRQYLAADGTPMGPDGFASLQAQHSGQAVYNIETGVVKEDGEVVWTSVSAVPVDFPDWKTVIVTADITERKQAEQTIASLARFPAENPSPVMRVDLSGRILYANPASATILDFWGREVGQAVPATFLEAIQQPGVVHDIELELNNRIFAFSLALAPEAGYLNVYGKDITERKQAEQKLGESERQMRALVTSLDDLVFEVDEQGTYLNVWTVNEANLFQPLEQVIGRRFDEIFGPEASRPFFAALERVLQSGKPESIEYSGELPEGTRWFGARYSPLIIEGQPCHSVSILVRDITKRKQAEEEIRLAREFLENIINLSPFAMWIADREGTVTRVNRSLCEKINLTEAEIVGKYNILKDANLEIQGVMPEVRAVFEQHQPARFNIPWKALNAGAPEFERARDMHIDVSIFPILDSQGELTNVVCQWVDFTEQKKAEEKLRESNEKFNALFYNAPLQGVIYRLIRDAQGKVVDWELTDINPLGAASLGQKAPDLIGRRACEMFGMEAMASYLEICRQVVGTGQPQLFETHFQVNDRHYLSAVFLLGADYYANLSVNITEQKLAEQKLRESESRYRLIAENTADVIWVLDPVAGKFTYVSPSVEKLRGYSPEEVMAQPVSEALTPESLELVNRSFATNLPEFIAQGSGTRSFVSEVDQPRKDGSIVHTEVTTTYLFNERGDVEVVGVTRDITERKRAEAELRESEERFSIAFFTNPVSQSILAQATGLVIEVNDACCSLFEYSRDELIGADPGQLNLWANPAEQLTIFEELQRTGHLLPREITIRRKSGEIRTVLFAVEPITWKRAPCLITSSVDITERKQAEEQRQKSELLFRTLFELSPDAIILIDPYDPQTPSAIVDCNTAACLLNGYQREELIGQPIEILNVAPYSEPGRLAYLERLRTEGALKLEVLHRRQDGSVFPIETSTTLIKIGERELLIGIDRDITERKQAEAALRASENRLNSIIETAMDAIIALDGDQRIIIFNRAAEEMFRLPAVEALGRSFGQFLPELQKHYKRVIELSSEPNPFVFFNAFHSIIGNRADGEEFPAEVSISFLETDQGKIYTNIVRDITERKRAEEKLREREELLSLMGRTAQVGGWEFNPVTGEGNWTEEVARIHDLDPSAQTNKEIGLSFYHGESRARIEAAIRDAIEHGASYDLDLEIVSAAGTHKWIRTIGHPVVENGQVVRLRGSFQDITERKLAEEKLRASEVRFATVFHFSPNAIALTRQLDGQLIDVNRAWEDLTGWSRAEALEKKPVALNLWVDSAERERLKAQMREQGRVQGFEMQMRARSGTILSLLMAAEVITLQDEPCMLSIAQDITERKKMEDELRRSNAELEQFAYVASHDLQEPLRAVAGMVQLLQKKYHMQLDERADEYIYHAVEAANRMQALISDLLAYSRVDRRGKALEPVSMQQALDVALANLQVVLQENGAEITSGELPTVLADPSQLVQVFQNLIGNAIKFRGEQPPKIRIDVTKLSDAYQFTVCDNGIGIEPQYFDRIFLVFQRLHTRREYPGTGIGLALCKKIIERHGGRIWVESEPGQGSKFHFTLPIGNRLRKPSADSEQGGTHENHPGH